MADNDGTALGGVDGLAVTNLTSTLIANQSFTDKLATLPSVLYNNLDLLTLEFRIVFTALACIYLGAHGALRRPPSATVPKPKGRGSKGRLHKEDDYVQGLLPSDAIMFPVLAGVVLVGLYYLIKWLEDPDILNKILGAYFSIMSLASLGKLLADTLQFFTTFVFPTVWRAKDGTVYHIDAEKKAQWHLDAGSNGRVWDEHKRTPFPGRWSESNVSDAKVQLLWGVRNLFLEDWTLRFTIHGLANEKMPLRLNDIFGFILAIVATIIYYTTKSVLLSNIMGYAFSYLGIIMMSPTTFTTGSLVLFGLFFYDIYMVFYTPYMVTVATKLDVPIKLVFQGPKKASMLGLGDIVIPGMFIGLCLRFDLFLYYHRQRKLVPVELETETESSSGSSITKETQHMVVKPEYINPQGQWGDRWWGTKITRILFPDATPELQASAFPKPYFYASMIGYLLAMGATLAMLLVFNHAQPALLYLVPGVVFSVWLTGLVRGEIREMWIYTEDGSLDGSDVIVEVDGNGNITKETNKTEKNMEGDPKEMNERLPTASEEVIQSAEADKPATSEEYCVFNFSVMAPALASNA